MSDENSTTGNDKGIGEGNLRGEPGAPPYADKQYAGEQEEPSGGSNSQTGTAGGANVSDQGGGAISGNTGGNAGGQKDASG